MIEENIEINGLKIFTRIAGEGSPFLILHGWGRGHISWIEVQDKLSKHFQVITLDLPGFGKSDMPPKGWDVQNYVDFIWDFTQKIGIDSFYLLGHSFGGSVAIKLAAQSPQKIRKLILVDSAGRRPKKSFSKKVLAPVASVFKIFSFLPGYEILRKCFYRFILRNTDYLEAKGVMKEIFKKVVEEDLANCLSSIKIETLILWGREDKVTPLKDGYLMEEKIPNSKLIILDNGHSPHLNMPDEVSNSILKFIN